MEVTPLELQITNIPEWDAEDEFTSEAAGEVLIRASDTKSEEMLNAIRLELPRVIEQVKLLQYARERQTHLNLTIPPDCKHCDFYLIELPLNILVPNLRMVRLRLRLELKAIGQVPEPIVAYDLFPNDRVDVRTIMTGEASLDVSKALKYILVATGAGAAAAPLTECFGLKLDLPFKWTSTYSTIQTSDRLSNPVEWYVTDSSIQNGFTGNVIIRAPKHAQVKVIATLSCEVRKAGLAGRILKAQYITVPRTYLLKN
jgi:hypothetical protein